MSQLLAGEAEEIERLLDDMDGNEMVDAFVSAKAFLVELVGTSDPTPEELQLIADAQKLLAHMAR